MSKKIYRPSIIKLLYVWYKAEKYRAKKLQEVVGDIPVARYLFTYSQTVHPGKYILTNTKTNKHTILDLSEVLTEWWIKQYVWSTRASQHKYNKYVASGKYGTAISYVYKSISVKSKNKNKLAKKVGSLLFDNFSNAHESLPPKGLAVEQ